MTGGKTGQRQTPLQNLGKIETSFYQVWKHLEDHLRTLQTFDGVDNEFPLILGCFSTFKA